MIQTTGVAGTIEDVEYNHPTARDGIALNRLVASSPPLDPNSIYCNLLQCTHFADTAISAKRSGKLIGCVTGYLLPKEPTTLFVWQIVVDESVRGMGIAMRMIEALLASPSCQHVTHIETTITPKNTTSRSLFDRLASSLGAETSVSIAFDKQEHFAGLHDTEEKIRIGPLTKQEAFR